MDIQDFKLECLRLATEPQKDSDKVLRDAQKYFDFISPAASETLSPEKEEAA